jgi:hypothetical protein
MNALPDFLSDFLEDAIEYALAQRAGRGCTAMKEAGEL